MFTFAIKYDINYLWKKNQLKNLNVYVCSSGTGKSYLAKQNNNYLDMDFLKLKCKYMINDDVTPQNIEYLKGNYNFKRNPDFPENYFDLINSSLKDGKGFTCSTKT